MSLGPLEWKDAEGNTCRLRVSIDYPNGDTGDYDAECMRHVLPALLNEPELAAAVREALAPTEEAQAQPLLRSLVQRFCEAMPEDIEKATVAELVGMCELECNAEHERAVAAEQTVQRLRQLRADAQTLARALEHSDGQMGAEFQAAFDRVQSDAYKIDAEDDDSESDDLTCDQKLQMSEQAHMDALDEAHKLTHQVGELSKLLHTALVDATEQKESWIDEARQALGLRPEFNLRKAYNKSLETIKHANDTAEERLQEIWKLEEQIRQLGGEHWKSGDHNRMADSDPGVFGDLAGAIGRAMLQPTLTQALSSVAIWDSERLVRQAFKNAKYGRPDGHPLWETVYETLFEEVIARFDRKGMPPPPEEDQGLPTRTGTTMQGPMQKAHEFFSQALEHEYGSKHHTRYMDLALKEALLYLNSLPGRVAQAKDETEATDAVIALGLLSRHLEK